MLLATALHATARMGVIAAGLIMVEKAEAGGGSGCGGDGRSSKEVGVALVAA